jgi:hypothetical protein
MLSRGRLAILRVSPVLRPVRKNLSRPGALPAWVRTSPVLVRNHPGPPGNDLRPARANLPRVRKDIPPVRTDLPWRIFEMSQNINDLRKPPTL